ncbi:uncharacterized protein A1O5_00802 [Cladophialophora psammophila CBS 110553]|uniref:Major facilitator superfamily (MFS) profile domain-containing protein n=1 Tax=Cladophialophora psammophila CBS 110553 TaxID=1182543 RepID=W9Y1D3_9EURO|nr:uncharacterized protein A1O5_00802 [Cladophialophora psammophila CBS 110553]EXJ76294.1 hypothetical protein A1O5_00802 [Cladophialophora psammophila CBS 110553]
MPPARGTTAVVAGPDVETTPLLRHSEVQASDDPDVVHWGGPDDPENPLNWSARKRWLNIILLSYMTFLTPFASSMFAPGIPQVLKDFNSHSIEMASLVVSVYVLGYAFGPLVIAPLSEVYGRKPLYITTSILFLIFTLGCGVSMNIGMLVAFRFLAGTAGSCPITVGSGTIADTFRQEERGRIMGLWQFSVLFGPSLGPVLGSWIAESYGWRWDFYVLAICTAVYIGLAIPFQDETYPVLLLERKVERLRAETGNQQLRSALATSAKSPRHLLFISITRPIKLLCGSLIVFGCSLYVAVGYGYMYLIFSTITRVFLDQYHFNRSTVGLVFLGVGIGQFISLGLFSVYSDKLLQKLAKAKGGQMKPEYRLPLLWPGAVLVPAGLLVYGWSAEYKLHPIIPIIGTGLLGAGTLWTLLPIGIYLVDAFTVYAASATAATTVLRSILGALVPLAGARVYDVLGLGWGNTVLAGVSVALTPLIWVFIRYGEVLRNHPRFEVKL